MKHKQNCKETTAFILKHNTHPSSFPNYIVFTFYYYSFNNTLIFEVKIMKQRIHWQRRIFWEQQQYFLFHPSKTRTCEGESKKIYEKRDKFVFQPSDQYTCTQFPKQLWKSLYWLALFLCSCRRQAVPSTLYQWKEIPVHETWGQCVSPLGEKIWALELQSTGKKGKIYSDNLFPQVPAPPEREFGWIALLQVVNLILLFPREQEWLWSLSYILWDLKSTRIHWNLSFHSKAEKPS